VALAGVYSLKQNNTVVDARGLTVAPALAKATPPPPNLVEEPQAARPEPRLEQEDDEAPGPSPRDNARSVVSVRTAPPAAAVLQDGSELGTTPLDVSMSKGTSLTLLLKKKGFVDETLELRADDGARVVTLRRREHERRERRFTFGSRRPKDRASRVGATLPNSEPPQAPSPEKSSPYERF
jgi:hypothetical protein